MATGSWSDCAVTLEVLMLESYHAVEYLYSYCTGLLLQLSVATKKLCN